MLTKRRRNQSPERGWELFRPSLTAESADTWIAAPCLPEFAIASSVRSATPDICSHAVLTTTDRTWFRLGCTLRMSTLCIAPAEDLQCLANGDGAR
jgi:hypothetical protein